MKAKSLSQEEGDLGDLTSEKPKSNKQRNMSTCVGYVLVRLWFKSFITVGLDILLNSIKLSLDISVSRHPQFNRNYIKSNHGDLCFFKSVIIV